STTITCDASYAPPPPPSRCASSTSGTFCSLSCHVGDVLGASGIHAGGSATCGGATASCDGTAIDCLAGGAIVQRDDDMGRCTMTTSGEYAECFALASPGGATSCGSVVD